MRKYMILCLMLVGCAQQNSPVLVHDTGSTAPAATEEQVMAMTANGAGNFSVVKKGVAMGLVNWRVVIKNVTKDTATVLYVDIKDHGGRILAQDDRHVNVKPGETLELTGFTDIPTADIERMSSCTAYLSIDGRKAK